MKIVIDVDSEKYDIKVREIDCRDCDFILAKIICQTLIEFKKNSVPPEKTTKLDWNIIIDKMIYAFQQLSTDEYPEDLNKNVQNKIREGLKLFTKYYTNLWYET